ncbi:ribonuclease H-like superfamily protein [Striga asiatica]|uniref:Ribonuclease H-like superfamily protein n=1 Tax=Striga asiatica TaxID=4170 RepID=A0A5A7R135_STRAF|nr:ribonuclease H-like superfamily protein [Striga asiatica]
MPNLLVKDKYKHCFKIQIGDGLTTRIWQDPWISSSTSGYPQRDVSNNSEAQWIFNETDSAKILEIKSLNPDVKDKWVWMNDAKKDFSVAKTYSTLVEDKFRKLNVAESSRSARMLRKTRSRTWKFKVKGKLKHFVWKCFSEALPVKVALRRRGMFVDGTKFRTWWGDVCSINKLEVSEARIELTTYILWWLWKMPSKSVVKMAPMIGRSLLTEG